MKPPWNYILALLILAGTIVVIMTAVTYWPI